MNKKEIIDELSRTTGLSKSEVMVVLDNFFELIQSQVAIGEAVSIRNFGTFLRKARAAKIARNLQKNTQLILPARFTPSFRAAQCFCDVLNPTEKNSKKC